MRSEMRPDTIDHGHAVALARRDPRRPQLGLDQHERARPRAPHHRVDAPRVVERREPVRDTGMELRAQRAPVALVVES
jgi:hypothetical protein